MANVDRVREAGHRGTARHRARRLSRSVEGGAQGHADFDPSRYALSTPNGVAQAQL